MSDATTVSAAVAAKVPGKMFTGTVVSTVEATDEGGADGHEAMLFSATEFNNRFGRFFDPSKDYVGAMNADGDAGDYFVTSATYWGHSGNIWVGTPGAINGNPVRINYLVILAD